ncbi:peptidylprolyl isomerase [Patescibacteria group bacterium]|nr:peptidylprolyl isomerase [Patescibacteria group bacterium]MBU1722149.1 peptidylprolyl isomerase [Patescibacteria group bacterium]MBU1901198.1 peptidylprolyl isomerase [Patescibacteria group bacterium]
MEETQKKDVQLAPVQAQKAGQSTALVLVGGFLGAIALVFIVGYLIVNQQVSKGSEHQLVVKAATVLQVPAAKINGQRILYSDFLEDKYALLSFYESEGANEEVSEEEIEQGVVSRLLATALVEYLVDQEGIEISEEDIKTRTDALIAEVGSEELLLADIQEKYGWTIETFVKKVVRPLLLEEKLREVFESADVDDAYAIEEVRARHILFLVEDEAEDALVKEQAQSVLDRIKAGEDFATLAQEFGSDGTAEQGGDLGWFGRGMMVPEFEDAIFVLDAGQLGQELVQTQFGYHIVQVDEKRTVNDFASYMQEQFMTANVDINIPVANPLEQ